MANEYSVNEADLKQVADVIRERTKDANPLAFPGGFAEAIQNIVGGIAFEIAGGKARPENPKEKTIWVDTENGISEIRFDASRPSNPVEGIVWFKTAANSPLVLDVLNDHTIMLYPVAAEQYASGAWIKTDAFVFQNGEWSSMQYISHVLQNGTILLGGSYTNASSTKFEDGKIKSPSMDINNGNHGYLSSRINVDQFNTLRIHADITAIYSDFYAFSVGMSSEVMTKGGYEQNKNKMAALTTARATGKQWIDVDISDLTGSWYFAIASIAAFEIEEILLTNEVS